MFSTSLPVETFAIDLGDNYSISADSAPAMYCYNKMTAGDHLTVTLKGASEEGGSTAIFVYKEMADLTVGNHAVVTTDMTSEGMVINDAGNRGIGVEKGARMKVGDDLSVSVTQHGKLTQKKDLYGVFINKKSSLTLTCEHLCISPVRRRPSCRNMRVISYGKRRFFIYKYAIKIFLLEIVYL